MLNAVRDKRFSSGTACKSWHGSLNRGDSYVPFIVSYPGGNQSEIEPVITAACTDGDCSGNWNLADITKEIINLQFSKSQEKE